MTDNIEIRIWIHRGCMFYNAYALPPNDPDSAYQQVVAQGAIPENYGIFNSFTEKYKDWTKPQLINALVELQEQFNALERFLA